MVSGQRDVTNFFISGKEPRAHWVGGWVNPEASLDVLGRKKSLTIAEIRNSDRSVRS
jgi:hypothetical protein